MPGLIVADDFQPVRHRLRMFLEAKGWGPCQEAANGAEALTLARRSKPDAVILDYSMPVMNGVETAKAFHDEMPDVQVFMFTGHVNRHSDPCRASPQLVFFERQDSAVGRCAFGLYEECRSHHQIKKSGPQPGGHEPPTTVHAESTAQLIVEQATTRSGSVSNEI